MRRDLIPQALGQYPADLVLGGGDVLDVFTGRLFRADVAVSGGVIVGVGRYSGRTEVDVTGKIVAPGFIDGHVHIESSMVSPGIFARHVLPRGTTTVIADPHEITNVCGGAGINYLLDEGRSTPLGVYLMLPSAVPLGDFERSGGTLEGRQMLPYIGDPQVLGLGEVMDVNAVVLGQDDGIWEKLDLSRDGVLDGHAPGLTGEALQAYLLAGISTEHECSTWAEAEEKLRGGMFILMREASAARNVTDLATGAARAGIPLDRLGFCSDDKHLGDIDREGHMDHNIRLAIAAGIDPVSALTMASYNTARAYGLRELGAVAPGYRADLVVLDDLETVAVTGVYKDGVPLAQCLAQVPPTAPEAMGRTVNIPPLPPDAFRLVPDGPFPVIELVPGQILTRGKTETLPTDERGAFAPAGGLNKVAVVQRHDGSGRMTVGALAGFGLTGGALASTVAHDAHNLIVVGDNDGDMHLAVNALRDCGGGYALAAGGQVRALLPLPVGG